MDNNEMGRVALVGAGCGSADWITVKGLRLLRECDAVVYDDLIDRALLGETPPRAGQHPVGKCAGRHSAEQEEINALLIDLARRGKTVVRLKGGDPYVFGRGGEEALALREAGIPYEVVPGISSALAIPLEAGIPPTHRGVSQGVHIMTAHTADDLLPAQLGRLARLDGTLVFLMGLSRLSALTQALLLAGMRPDTPAAALSGGCAAQHIQVRATLETLAAQAACSGIAPPAVIVVGAAAAIDLRAGGALNGVRVGLTGTPEFQEKLRAPLAALCAETVSVQTTVCAALPAEIDWDQIGATGQWLAFTSARGVSFFFQRLMQDGVDLRRLGCCRFAVIGTGTADALLSHGIHADLCPTEFTSEALAGTLAASVEPEETVWLFQAERGSDEVRRRLGSQCRTVPIYRVSYRMGDWSAKPDALVFGSAGAVHALADAGYTLSEKTEGYCVDPVSAKAFACRFGKEARTSSEYTADALIRLVLHELENRGA